MNEIINTFITQFKDLFKLFYNKPYHVLIVSIAVSYLEQKNHFVFTIGILLIIFSLVTIVETWISRFKQKQRIQTYYKELKGEEKEIIEYCLKEKTLVYRTTPLDDDKYTNAIYSLVGKGFGNNITFGGDFIMFNEIYELLK